MSGQRWEPTQGPFPKGVLSPGPQGSGTLPRGTSEPGLAHGEVQISLAWLGARPESINRASNWAVGGVGGDGRRNAQKELAGR